VSLLVLRAYRDPILTDRPDHATAEVPE